jgi:LmbE family N-acetylglucosaminyl deacetylase
MEANAKSRLRKWRLDQREHRTLEAAGKLLGISAVQMLRLETGERKVPATRVLEVEAITGIPREILRPDVFGRRRSHGDEVAA